MDKIIHGNCLRVLEKIDEPVACIFADPPDNLNLNYQGYADNIDKFEYAQLLARWIALFTQKSPIVWLSHFRDYLPITLAKRPVNFDWKLILWRYTFGQNNANDFGSGYRPILRYSAKDAVFYPRNCLVPSARLNCGDPRANPDGRVPDDVWEFSRVCGNFPERRQWHPTQHPEKLIERIILFSTKENDLVVDPFGGTGTTLRVCRRLNRRCITVDISRYYCEKMSTETGVPLITV
jgi:site-specific DNA-methyltransferase (adenine-specific)